MSVNNYSGHEPKSYTDGDFLQSPEARSLRIAAEYVGPKQQFHDAGINQTIIFFGSARICSNEEFGSRKHLLIKEFQDSLESERPLIQKKIDVLLKQNELTKYYDDAVELSRKLTEWSNSLPKEKRLAICSGGGPGIMEAANRGAYLAGGDSIGLNISLPHEQYPNPYISENVNLEFHYFFMRKFWFVYLAKALVVFPGGFGTCDELFDILTLVQTGKIGKPLSILIYGENFWRKVLNFEYLIEAGMIAESDVSLFKYANTPDEAFEFLKNELTQILEL
ncbi:MAG: TIGR00730 family Rossman fold protein [Bacteroidetes bacterium]|nr:TIGR00730 family Rossman fold protein [Bacteroidota bacterium]